MGMPLQGNGSVQAAASAPPSQSFLTGPSQRAQGVVAPFGDRVVPVQDQAQLFQLLGQLLIASSQTGGQNGGQPPLPFGGQRLGHSAGLTPAQQGGMQHLLEQTMREFFRQKHATKHLGQSAAVTSAQQAGMQHLLEQTMGEFLRQNQATQHLGQFAGLTPAQQAGTQHMLEQAVGDVLRQNGGSLLPGQFAGLTPEAALKYFPDQFVAGLLQHIQRPQQSAVCRAAASAVWWPATSTVYGASSAAISGPVTSAGPAICGSACLAINSAGSTIGQWPFTSAAPAGSAVCSRASAVCATSAN